MSCKAITYHLLFCCLLLVWLPAVAEKQFDFNATCRQAYQEIVKLKLVSGQQLINQEKQRNPDNLIPYFLENYIDFFTLFFNEDPAEYKARKAQHDLRIDLMGEGPEDSPFFLFTKSIINFQWAAVRIKFGQRWDAGWEFRRSFIQIKYNRKAFKDFSPNDMIYGSMQVAIGTVPDGYRWLSNLFGMKGSIKNGMQTLTGFLNKQDEWAQLFHDEAVFYYLYLKFHIENKPEEVFSYIKQKKLDVKNNHLFTYLAANLALNNQQSAYAKTIIAQRNPSGEYMTTQVWNLEMGYAKINHLEPDAAPYFESFIQNFKGKFYLRDALQKLSWHYYLQGNTTKAQQYRDMIPRMGNSETEADKKALKDAKTGQWPHPLLLRSRLLNDGGYHKEALDVLLGKTTNDFAQTADKAEFAYRLARIYDDMGYEKEAIEAYLTTMKIGADRKEYFAARAALQTGYIYEKRGDKALAIVFFEKCLAMKDHDYKNSLDQRAKAGIARCKGE